MSVPPGMGQSSKLVETGIAPLTSEVFYRFTVTEELAA